MAKILIVDDEPDLLVLMSHVARSAGHSVSLAHNGVEALAAVEADPPDVIILDIHMPVMGGLEVLEALWVRALGTGRPLIPVIVLTADCDPSLVRLTQDLGAREFFVKAQVQPDQLEASIAHLARAA